MASLSTVFSNNQERVQGCVQECVQECDQERVQECDQERVQGSDDGCDQERDEGWENGLLLQNGEPVQITLLLMEIVLLYFYIGEGNLFIQEQDFYTMGDVFTFNGVIDCGPCILYVISSEQFTCPSPGLRHTANIRYVIVPQGEITLTPVGSRGEIVLAHGGPEGEILLTHDGP